tara:strand:+ start:500 stop:667 length:168 start_codon:yes stop_codon:yes gene_type:complete
MIRYVYAAILRITFMCPLFLMLFIGSAAEEAVKWFDKVLPWMYKETKEERRIRLL